MVLVVHDYQGGTNDVGIHTTDGSAFSATTISPAITTPNFGYTAGVNFMGLELMPAQYPPNQIIATIKDGFTVPSSQALYQLVGTVWTEKFDPGVFLDYFMASMPDRFWRFDDAFNDTLEGTDFVTWNKPSRQQVIPARQYGFNESVGNSVFPALHINVWYWNDPNEWDLALLETMTDATWPVAPRAHGMWVMDDGSTYALLDVSAHGVPGGADEVWKRDVNRSAPIDGWGSEGNSPPDMPLPCDIDADGGFLYVAALNIAGSPILLKLDTDLDTDPTLVFDPGSGTNIGVICGKENADTVWIGGDFGNTNVLEKSEDGGETFTVKDDGTFGPLRIFTVGPDSDDRVLLVDDSIDIQETLDSGDTWAAINSGLGFSPISLARLAVDVVEMVYGNESGVADNIDYSLDSGANFEDLTVAPFPSQDVKRVIVN